jgi:hypothetical protein
MSALHRIAAEAADVDREAPEDDMTHPASEYLLSGAKPAS